MPRLMKQAAIGIRMHSGWGALVSVTGPPQALEIIDRRRIVVIEPGGRRAGQPYHHAATLPFSAADKYLKKYAETSRRLALAALREVLEELKSQCHRIAGAAILLAADRALPPLEQILAAHPLIHTAEGEFFRMVVREACEQLRVHVIGIRERDLEDQAKRYSALQRSQCRKGSRGWASLWGRLGHGIRRAQRLPPRWCCMGRSDVRAPAQRV
jgi:hypothetical protein